VLVLAVLVLAFALVGEALAAPVTWYRTGATATGSYRSLATSPGGANFSTSVAHGASTGSFRFQPATSDSTTTGFPGSTASGQGYATTSTLTGTLPAGRWSFDATVRTDTPADAAQGVLAVAVYVLDSSGSRRVGFQQGSTNVLAGPGDRSVTLSTDLPELSLNGARIATEWYLVIQQNTSAAAGSTTALRHGHSGDTVTVPGPVAAPALAPPGTLQVTGVGDNRIALSWQASSDSRVTGYVVRRAGASDGPWVDVSTVAGTSFTDAGLVNGTRYYHSVVAVAADGSRSTASNVTSAVPSDAVAPSRPGTPTVSPSGSFRLAVSWGPSSSTDVVGYEVQRSGSAGGPFSRIAGPVAGTSFTDDGLPSGSTWHYRVVAIDDDGLRSTPTAPAAGTVAPSPPGGLRVAAVADGAVALEWNAVPGAVEYVLERATGAGFTAVARPTGTSFTDGGLVNGTTYTYRVRAVDGAGAASSPSGSVQATPQDTGLPAPPTALSVSERGRTSVRLTWTASASSSTVGYRVLRAREDGAFTEVSGLISGTRFDDGPLPIGVPHHYRVVAEDASGSRSIPATGSYTVAPSAPGNLRVVGVSESTVALAWDASDDPRARYRVLRADQASGPYTAVSGLLDTRSFTDGGLVLGEEYHYVVHAEAVDGTRSPSSNRVRVTPVNGPPTPPTGLVAADTGAGGQVSLSWPPNLEADVSRYRIERSTGGTWTAIHTTSSTAYLDDGLVDGRTYHYRLVAIDDVGLTSEPSEPVSVVPSDTEPPPAPGQPTLSRIGAALQVQWLAVPTATSYTVLRATSPGGPFLAIGTTTERSLRDTSVQRGVTYYYAVRAADAAANLSPMSPVASGIVELSAALPGTSDGGGTDGSTTGGPTDGTTGGQALFPPIGPTTPRLDPNGPPAPGSSQDPPNAAPDPQDGSGGGSGSAVNTESIFVAAPGGPSVVQEGSAADQALQALSEGDLRRAIQRTAEDVADKVGDVAVAFRVPLVVLLLLAVYLVVQGRIDRGAVLAAPEAATGGEDDDVEYLL